METLGLLMEGFAGALTPMNLLWVVLGCLLGTAVGVMPVSYTHLTLPTILLV